MTLDPAWRPLVGDPARAALFVDFDGSLAPIVADPDHATPVAGAEPALRILATRLGCVAVVTGRPVAFVRGHLPDPALVVVGQYGLEHDARGSVVTDPRVRPFAPAVAAAAAEAERRWPGLRVERKGSVAVTVHWRTARADAPTPDALDALAAAHGLVAFPLAGTDLRVAAFAGDDHGDLAAFAELDRWAAALPARTALRIAVASDESPAALLQVGDLVLDGPVALVAQLVALAAALPRP